MSVPPSKRRRRSRSPSPVYKLDDENDDDYAPYIPVAQRKQAKLAAIASLTHNDKRHDTEKDMAQEVDEIDEEDRAREKDRKQRTLLLEAQEVHRKKALEGLSPTLIFTNQLFFSLLHLLPTIYL